MAFVVIPFTKTRNQHQKLNLNSSSSSSFLSSRYRRRRTTCIVRHAQHPSDHLNCCIDDSEHKEVDHQLSDTSLSSSSSSSSSLPSYFSTCFEDASTRVSRLQEELDAAVSAEQFSNAALLRDELADATKEDSVLVLSALMSYYDAFSNQNVDRIRHQWHDQSHVTCQHPLISPNVGYHDVINGYRLLFSTLPNDFSISMSDVRISSHGDVAYVTCKELPHSASLDLDMRNDGHGISNIDKRRLETKSKTKWHGLLATHVFEKVWDYKRQKFQYLLVHHVSSPILTTNNKK